MRSIVCIAPMFLLLFGCKSTSYHYVSPSLNQTPYAYAGMGQVGVQFGTIGLGAKGGVAITDNINVNAYFGGFPEAENGYTSRESEFSLGFQTTPNKKSITSFYIGMGIGNNEKDKIGLMGNYNRPFIQIQRMAYDRAIFKGKLFADAGFGARLNYLLYNGKLHSANFDENVFYTEPYMGFAIGGRNFRLEILQGVTIKSSGTWEKGVRIFPYFGNIGFTYKIRKQGK